MRYDNSDDDEEFGRNEAICPFCKKVQKDSFELINDLEGFRDDVECQYCEKTFTVSKSCTFFYTTRKPK